MTPDDLAGGPLDVATLAVMGRRAVAHSLVEHWRFRPEAISPRVLELRLDAARYPGPVTAARLDVRWFEDGAYTVHYLETRGDVVWQCRWDQHPKPGTPAAHFHPPPGAAAAPEASPLEASNHLRVLFAVLEWVGDRVDELHAQ